jgi:mono/diheme cytochrome c family protein
VKHIALAFAGLVLAVSANSEVQAQSTLPEGVTEAMVQEGKQIYSGVGICAACHGPEATGLIGPDLTDAEWIIGDGEYEQLVEQILIGVPAEEVTNPLGAIMPPKGGGPITEAQVKAVAAYIWTLSQTN